jgi:hypothetical protein
VVGVDIITNSLLHGHASFKISPKSLAFSLLRKCKDYDLQKYNFSFCFVWVCNLIANIEGKTKAEGVCK